MLLCEIIDEMTGLLESNTISSLFLAKQPACESIAPRLSIRACIKSFCPFCCFTSQFCATERMVQELKMIIHYTAVFVKHRRHLFRLHYRAMRSQTETTLQYYFQKCELMIYECPHLQNIHQCFPRSIKLYQNKISVIEDEPSILKRCQFGFPRHCAFFGQPSSWILEAGNSSKINLPLDYSTPDIAGGTNGT